MSGFTFEFISELPEAKDFQKYEGSEDDFQKSVAWFLDCLNATYTHPPNGGSRNKIEAVKLKKMGVKSGVPDVLIFDPKHGYNGFAIELKVGRNTVSEAQKEWLTKLKSKGWLVLVSYSLEEVIHWVEWYYQKK